MTGLVYLGASAFGCAAALGLIARATLRLDGDRVSPVLACDLCPTLVTVETAHRPHEPGCPGEGCRCDRLVCALCCDDPACTQLTTSTA